MGGNPFDEIHMSRLRTFSIDEKLSMHWLELKSKCNLRGQPLDIHVWGWAVEDFGNKFQVKAFIVTEYTHGARMQIFSAQFSENLFHNSSLPPGYLMVAPN